MDVSGVFSKLKNTLTSTVNEISAALPGNPLLREYDAGCQVASAGPNNLWKIYEGMKKSTKAEVAIWSLEKKQLEQFNRTDRELILDILRRGCLQMTKLRHPRIVTVEHAFEESRDSIVFCTEPVFASLANVLGMHGNIANPTKELQGYELNEVELKYGILQVSEGLAFLHTSVKMTHGNICPESVIINKIGSWKIAGFDFCIPNSGSLADVEFAVKEWDTYLPAAAQPDPNYLAPEYILRKSCDTSSDLFSLGMLLYALYHRGKTIFSLKCEDVYRRMPHNADKLQNLSAGSLSNIPDELKDHERMLLNPDPNVRPDAEQMSKLPFFNHVGVMALQYLDSLLQRDNLQKSQFFKGLPKILPQLPKRVVVQRVFPNLTSEFQNPDMIPFVLPNVMIIAENCTKTEFDKIIFPKLIPVFKIQKPIQVLLILLQNMDLLLSKTAPDKVQSHILPMLSSALDAPSLQIQELSMNIIPSFAEQLDLPAVKNNILPRIKKISLQGGSTAIRIHGLVCVGKLLPLFDKWFIQDEILTFLHNFRSGEPGVLMAILGVYQSILRNDKLGISKDVIAGKSLPFLIPLSIESCLNVNQFASYMRVIKELLQLYETEQRIKLEQLNKIQLEQDAALSFTKEELPPVSQPTENVDKIFSSMKQSTDPVARQPLTLEEKQRMARMKEQEHQMKSVGMMKPVQQNKAVRDLTSTLPPLQKQTNLRSMTSKSTNKTSQPMVPNMRNMTSSTSLQFGQNLPMTSHFGLTTSAGPWGNTSSPSYPSYNPSMTSQTNSSKTNMTSLDNLFVQSGQQTFVTKPMMSQTPLMMSQSNNNMSQSRNNSNGLSQKTLSEKDLLDFLG
ncbi:unnamed protein product [Clavelina lepadiformis]|uniref:Protein kinase domain-containing protein n=1 Tax=Clavelina lepadiformis TaxID=159417 RepID=A0ABP0GEW3_CLALP